MTAAGTLPHRIGREDSRRGAPSGQAALHALAVEPHLHRGGPERLSRIQDNQGVPHRPLHSVFNRGKHKNRPGGAWRGDHEDEARKEWRRTPSLRRLPPCATWDCWTSTLSNPLTVPGFRRKLRPITAQDARDADDAPVLAGVEVARPHFPPWITVPHNLKVVDASFRLGDGRRQFSHRVSQSLF